MLRMNPDRLVEQVWSREPRFASPLEFAEKRKGNRDDTHDNNESAVGIQMGVQEMSIDDDGI